MASRGKQKSNFGTGKHLELCKSLEDFLVISDNHSALSFQWLSCGLRWPLVQLGLSLHVHPFLEVPALLVLPVESDIFEKVIYLFVCFLVNYIIVLNSDTHLNDEHRLSTKILFNSFYNLEAR